nr:hypothetical protein [Sphingomonas rubra]
MVMAIVLITALAKVSRAKYEAVGRHQSGEVQSADAMRAAEEVRLLKERVAVLERVVTDNHGSLGLDREIERLRDR